MVSKDKSRLSDEQRHALLARWLHAALAMGELAELAWCLNLANQLQMNDVGFDIHIQQIAPNIEGGLTTTITGFEPFSSVKGLSNLLERAMAELKESTRVYNT